MCGIFALLNNSNTFQQKYVFNQFNKGVGRGPEFTTFNNLNHTVSLGFHRLAINGLDEISQQPLLLDNYSLICNGEIYNYKELYKELGVTPKTNSDCEVILHLYKKYGIEQTLQVLDGVFSFILLDYTDEYDTPKVIYARDPYGVRPLYLMYPDMNEKIQEDKAEMCITNRKITTEPLIGLSSNLTMLNNLYNDEENEENDKESREKAKKYKNKSKLLTYFDETDYYNFKIKQVKPGTYTVFKKLHFFDKYWSSNACPIQYHKPGFLTLYHHSMNEIYSSIFHYLEQAVIKRVDNTDRPVACLLSGGLDSSLITALVNKHHKGILETYSIGMKGSDDLKNARLVANYLQTKHKEIVIDEDDFFNAIPETIQNLESYDTTTVRASVGNYLIAKYIAKHSKAKVIFNGDGSDEVVGGYMYFHLAPDAIEFDKECRRLLNDIYLYDAQRSDRCISSNGLEPRTPFLDRSFVEYYLSIPRNMRNHAQNKQCEKFMLRKAVEVCSPDLIPKEVLWRKKEAFSDGVSGDAKSWFQVIKDKLEENKSILGISTNSILKTQHKYTNEQVYYKQLFSSNFPNLDYIVPYLWMPRYVEATDASARTLDIYKTK